MTLCNATYEDLLEANLGVFDACPDNTCGQNVNRHRVRVAPRKFSYFIFPRYPISTTYFYLAYLQWEQVIIRLGFFSLTLLCVYLFFHDLGP